MAECERSGEIQSFCILFAGGRLPWVIAFSRIKLPDEYELSLHGVPSQNGKSTLNLAVIQVRLFIPVARAPATLV